MIIYLDIIFFYNFLIDWMLLWSVAFLLKLRPRWYRLGIGAAIGATYTLFLFLPPMTAFYTFSSKLFLAAMMIFSVFGYHRLRILLIRLLLFYLVSFVLGGGLFGISYLLKSENEILSGIVISHSGGMGNPATWLIILIGLPLIWYLSGKGVKQIRQVEKRHSLYGEMEVVIGENTVCCKGLIDTGNQLYEPITRVPVVIMEIELFHSFIPEKLYQAIKEKKDISMDLSFLHMDELWLQRVRIIPYRSVSRGMDLLLALRPDHLRVATPDGVYQTNRVLIGFNTMKLSSDGTYEAIIHPDIVDESNKITDQQYQSNKEAI